jgi:hypothetical protein
MQQEVRRNELLQKSLVKDIKKRNKYNASLRTSNNQFMKSNSQYLQKGNGRTED